MKSTQKMLFGLVGLGLFVLANNSVLAADAPAKEHSASSNEDHRESVRQRRREASLREMSSLRQKRSEQHRDAVPSESRSNNNNSSSNSGSNNNNNNNAASGNTNNGGDTRTPTSKPERANRTSRGKRSGSGN